MDDRPGLAIVANVPAPYRVHLHRRLAEGVPEFKLHSIFTTGPGDFKWTVDLPPEIHAVTMKVAEERPTAPLWHHPLREWLKGGRIIRYLHEHDVRVVVVHGYKYVAYVRVIAHCRRAGIPVFLRGDSNIRGDRPRGPLHAWIKRRLVGWVIRQVDGVFPVGRLGREYFMKYGARADQCFQVTFEPEYERFASAPARELDTFRAAHGLSPDRKYLLYSGRLRSWKRVDLLIDAFAEIAGDRPEWDVLIAGDGERQALEARVPEALRDRVIWTGFLEVDQMRLAYHAADIMVLPSEYEPWALVVNEAMAAGCPVVASDVVGAAWDMVADGVCGRLFPSGDLAALTGALRDVTDPARFESYRDAVGPALAKWRREADPVEGLRAALRFVGLLDQE